MTPKSYAISSTLQFLFFFLRTLVDCLAAKSRYFRKAAANFRAPGPSGCRKGLPTRHGDAWNAPTVLTIISALSICTPLEIKRERDAAFSTAWPVLSGRRDERRHFSVISLTGSVAHAAGTGTRGPPKISTSHAFATFRNSDRFSPSTRRLSRKANVIVYPSGFPAKISSHE